MLLVSPGITTSKKLLGTKDIATVRLCRVSQVHIMEPTTKNSGTPGRSLHCSHLWICRFNCNSGILSLVILAAHVPGFRSDGLLGLEPKTGFYSLTAVFVMFPKHLVSIQIISA